MRQLNEVTELRTKLRDQSPETLCQDFNRALAFHILTLISDPKMTLSVGIFGFSSPFEFHSHREVSSWHVGTSS